MDQATSIVQASDSGRSGFLKGKGIVNGEIDQVAKTNFPRLGMPGRRLECRDLVGEGLR